uniref:Uncharacterized protein n=1 Tax=Arundo donax TaxID=35708 RepID=A0A0A9BTK0_ARUDO
MMEWLSSCWQGCRGDP